MNITKFFEAAGVDVSSDKIKNLIEQEEAQNDVSSRISDDDLDVIYEYVKRNPLTREEIKNHAMDLVGMGRYTRSVDSAVFALTRMHILIHAIAPDGETQSRADTMFNIAQSMVDFVLRKGEFDLEDLKGNVKRAKAELSTRKVKRKEPEARQLMADFYKANKDSLPKDIVKHRERIIQALMNGASPEEAFNV